jgi:hypothetical protein
MVRGAWHAVFTWQQVAHFTVNCHMLNHPLLLAGHP